MGDVSFLNLTCLTNLGHKIRPLPNRAFEAHFPYITKTGPENPIILNIFRPLYRLMFSYPPQEKEHSSETPTMGGDLTPWTKVDLLRRWRDCSTPPCVSEEPGKCLVTSHWFPHLFCSDSVSDLIFGEFFFERDLKRNWPTSSVTKCVCVVHLKFQHIPSSPPNTKINDSTPSCPQNSNPPPTFLPVKQLPPGKLHSNGISQCFIGNTSKSPCSIAIFRLPECKVAEWNHLNHPWNPNGIVWNKTQGVFKIYEFLLVNPGRKPEKIPIKNFSSTWEQVTSHQLEGRYDRYLYLLV